MEKPFAGNPEELEFVLDEIVAFSTDLSSQDLAGDAALRRASCKRDANCAGPEERVEISPTECRLAFRAGAARRLVDIEHPARQMRLCACRRNDVAGRVAAIRRYEGRTPGLEAALSCRAYHGYLIEF